MHLNVSTCYGMQIILYLSRNKKVVSSSELSANLHISKRYIMYIAGKLRDGCLIITHAGMNGGYTLSKDASGISIYDVLTLLEGDTRIPESIRQCNNDCLRTTLSKVNEYWDALIKSLTFDQLADMDTSGCLSEIIGIAEADNIRL